MRYLLLIIAFISGNVLSAQLRCGHDIVSHQLEEKYPGVTELIDQVYKDAKNHVHNKAEVYRIPVVFHVVYNSEDQNLSDDLVREQIQILNEDFRRMNADAERTRDEFLDVAADAEIEFFLAGEDPDGNPTSGITHTVTDKTTFVELDLAALILAIAECGVDLNDPDSINDNLECLLEAMGDLDLDAVKRTSTGGIDPWPTDKYLNIWSCNMALDLMESAPFLLGFAYPPMGAPNWPEGTIPPNAEEVDGVVVHYQTVGRTNPSVGALAGLADQGRTCVHEVGHYLGLRHIWGDGDCSVDDGLEDTPPAGTNSQPQYDIPPCSDLFMKDSCMDDFLPDMIENYMDYSIESCQNAFTAQQVGIMRAMLEGPRASLLGNTISSAADIINVSFQVVPNPASDFFSIEGDQEIEQVQIFDQTGRLIKNVRTDFMRISTQNLSQGSYILQIQTENGFGIEKLIIIK